MYQRFDGKGEGEDPDNPYETPHDDWKHQPTQKQKDEAIVIEHGARRKFYVFVCCEVLLFLIGLGLILQVAFVPQFLTKQVKKAVEEEFLITESMKTSNSSAYDHWVNNNYSSAPVQIFQYYIYNITNPDEIMYGATPIVKEVGPYAYRRFEEKRNVIFNNDSSIVNYSVHYNYVEYPQKNGKGLLYNDTVYFPDPLLLSFVHSYPNSTNTTLYEQEIMWSEYILDSASKGTFGYPKARGIMGVGTVEELLNKQVGSNYVFNDIVCVDVSEYTGVGDYNRVRSLIKYSTNRQRGRTDLCHDINALPYIDFWAEPEYYNGSREFRLFPYNNWIKEDPLRVWAFDKFRQVNYDYKEKVDLYGLSLSKFSQSLNIFANATNVPSNAKYYQFGKGNGLLNVSSKPVYFFGQERWLRAPAYTAQGRFYEAPYYIKNVMDKLNLSQPTSEDETYFYVDPLSGIVFKSHGSTMILFEWSRVPEYVGSGNFSKNYEGKRVQRKVMLHRSKTKLISTILGELFHSMCLRPLELCSLFFQFVACVCRAEGGIERRIHCWEARGNRRCSSS